MLIIAEQKATAAHDIKGTLWNAALNAAQRYIQINSALLENKRHLPIIVNGAVIGETRKLKASVMCE